MNVLARLPLLGVADPAESPLFWLAILVLTGLIFVAHSYLFHRHYLPWTKEGKLYRKGLWALRTTRLIPSVAGTGDALPDGAQTVQIQIDGKEFDGLFFDRRGTDALLVVFPGEGEVADEFAPLATSRLSQVAGLSIWIVDYRGCGRNRKESLGPSTYLTLWTDAIAVFDAIPQLEEKRGRPFSRRVVLGRSIGSVAAMAVSAIRDKRVSAVILDGPIASVREKYNRECTGGLFPPDWPEDQPDVSFFADHVISPVLAFLNSGDSRNDGEPMAKLLKGISNFGHTAIIDVEGSECPLPCDGSQYDAIFPFLNRIPQDGSIPLADGMALSPDENTLFVNELAFDEGFKKRWKGFARPVVYTSLDYSLGLSRSGKSEPEPPCLDAEGGESFGWTAGETELVGFFQWKPRVARDVKGWPVERDLAAPKSSLAYVAAFSLYLRRYSWVARLILTLETSDATGEHPLFCEFNRNAWNERINHGPYLGPVDRDSVLAFFIDMLTNGKPEEMRSLGSIEEGWKLKHRIEAELTRRLDRNGCKPETCPTCGAELDDGFCPNDHTIVRCSDCGGILKEGVCPACGKIEICPACGSVLVDGMCPNGDPHVNHYRCPNCSAILKNGKCPNGCAEPEFCPTCHSELVDGCCPENHTVIRCDQCKAILVDCICPNGCNPRPLNLGWPGSTVPEMAPFMLEVIEPSEYAGARCGLPVQTVIGRSCKESREPFIEVLVKDLRAKKSCSRRYVKLVCDPNAKEVVVELLTATGRAIVAGKPLTKQGDTAPLSANGILELRNAGYKLRLVRAEKQGSGE